MRRAFRSALVTFVAILGAIGLTIGSAFAAALAFGAVAFIVPGTGTPNAGNVSNYMEQAQKRYLQDTSCAVAAECTLEGINYPASFWPLAFIPNWCRSGPDGCDKWDESVGKGTLALEDQLKALIEDPAFTDDVVVFGYSQGGAVVSNVLSGYINGLSPEQKARIKIVTIGGIQTPDGGLWPRLGFLGHIPILDVTLTPPMNPDTGVNFISYAFHFDPVADAPRYWGNPFAMLNAVAALQTVHGYYLTPNGNGPNETLPYGYTDDTLKPQLVCNVGVNCRVDSKGNQYITIPATSLPIADLIYQSTPALLRPLIKPFIELVAPAYRVLAELGYDYGGDPSVATPLSILPFNPFTFNPITFALKMAGAIVQGIVNALGGGTSLSPLNPPATANVTTVNAFSRLASDPGQDKQLALVEGQGSEKNLPDGNQKTGDVAALGDEQTVVDGGSGAVGQNAIDKAAAEKEAADKAAADKEAADKAAVDKEAADKAAADKATAENEAVEKAAAEQAAAEKDAADKAAARKEAADKAAAEKAAADKAEAAAAKAKAAADKEAADKAAADKTKEAAEKARETAAANNRVDKKDGAGVDENATDNGNEGTGESEKKAA